VTAVGQGHSGRQVKRSRESGQLGYTRAAREGIQVAVVCEDYLGSQISMENFADIQRAIGQLVDELPEEGFTPRLVESCWAKGAAIKVRHDELTKDCLAARVPTLVAWEGSRLKIVGLDALSTYKRVVAWFPGPMDTEWYLWLWRLNQGLDTGYWRLYECKEESKPCAQNRHSFHCRAERVEVETLQQGGTSHLRPSGY
jgi:hypothetical protein